MSNHRQQEITFHIKEVAEIIGVTPTTLRNWEKNKLFQARRGSNNYRIYNFDDIEQLEKIRFYLHTKKINSAGIKSLLHADYPKTKNHQHKNHSYNKNFLSQRWRKARKEGGFTLAEVSDSTGISTSYLSKIENGQANPSIEMLKILARFYRKNILHFFQSTKESKHLLPFSREQVGIDISGVKIDSLVGLKEHIMQPMHYTVQSGCGIKKPHAHEGEEFLYVLEGKIEMTLEEDEQYILDKGSSLYFRSRETHQWKNPGRKPAEILWVHVPYEG